MSLNRIANVGNSFQGTYKKVLCVCSAGLLRSPTAAVVLSQEPFNFNTRTCGLTTEFALIPCDDVLLAWADEIVCMDEYQQQQIEKRTKKLVINLEIGDCFSYRDTELIQMIKENYTKAKGISL